jgi:hypothetical protein
MGSGSESLGDGGNESVGESGAAVDVVDPAVEKLSSRPS